jgi:cyclopropane fatty-acyl-phospholipid synthase-like methyltransferase
MSETAPTSDDQNGRREYFEALYGRDADPWRYEDGPYEIAKRADTLSFLRPHYSNACEVGCSIGVLTEALAPRCDRLLGLDISETAAAIARRRLSGAVNVKISVRHLPYDTLEGGLDLLVLSEMLYFLSEAELNALAELAARSVISNGQVLIVSFDGETQTRLDGPASTAVFLAAAQPDFELIRAEQREHYHVRLLRRL